MKHFFRKIKRRFSLLVQWLKYGFTDRDTNDLNITFAQFILPRLKRFKEKTDIAPKEFLDEGGELNDCGMMAWRNTLQMMITGFELLADPLRSYHPSAEDQKIIDRTLSLFAKHYEDLWW